jgi:hypothetical protein
MPKTTDVPSQVKLQFVQSDDLTGRLIEWFGGGPRYSHVDIVTPTGMLLGARSDAVGGQPPGVRVRPVNYLSPNDRTLCISIPATSQQAAAFYDFLNAQIGKPYDKLAIFAFIIGRDWRDTDAWICSELAAAALQAGGITQPLAVAANKITPGALIIALSALVPVTLPN